MSETEYASAVKDILECKIKPKREMKDGRILTSILLGGQRRTLEQQRELLFSALQGMIEQKLLELRANHFGPDQAAAYTVLSSKQRLERDVRSGNSDLHALSIVWAYYVDGVSKKDIGAVYGLGVRAIEYRLNDVYAYIATLVVLACSSQESFASEHPSSSTQQPLEAKSAASQPRVYQYAETVVNGGTVSIDRRTITHNTRTTNHITTKEQSSNDIQLETALPLVITGGLLLAVMHRPVVATLVLLGVILWRSAANGWLAYNNWNASLFNEKTRENTWYVLYVLPWVGLCGFALYTAATLPQTLSYPPFEMPRIIFAVHLFFIGAGVLVLVLVDIMFFLHHLDDEHWISKLLPGWKERARNLWERRWQTVYICVAFIGVCLVGALVIANLWSVTGTSFSQ